LTAAIEGHPDNVGPAVYGGLTVAAERAGGDGYDTAVLAVPPGWRLLFGVPAFELPTERARAALPDHVSAATPSSPRRAPRCGRSRSRATSRACCAPPRSTSCTSRTASRSSRASASARAALFEAGAYAAYLSGAGPTLAAIAPEAALVACRAVLRRFAGDGGRVLELRAGDGYSCAPDHADA
jgi:homoserine kinase